VVVIDAAAMAYKADDFVSVTGVIHLHTALGTFVDVRERRVFVPEFFTPTLLRRYAPGEIVAIYLLRSYAEKQKLIAYRAQDFDS
jgi:hypothetical protein